MFEKIDCGRQTDIIHMTNCTHELKWAGLLLPTLSVQCKMSPSPLSVAPALKSELQLLKKLS
jgi:hypothetical protein